MAQSVKLSNGDYIDAGGIYDTAQSKTQEELNSTVTSEISRLNSFTTLLGLAGNGGGYWHKQAVTGLHAWYYGGVDISEYNLPAQNCFVIVVNFNTNRGAAMAIQWAGGTSGITKAWLNRLHDDTNQSKWAGWTKITTASTTG